MMIMNDNQLHNPFDEISDEEFLKWLKICGHTEPKWVRCSKDEYEAHMPISVLDDLKESTPLERIEAAAAIISGKYRRTPKTNSGILNRIRGEAKSIDYDYYKEDGVKRVFVCGSKMANWIIERKQKILNKIK